MRGNGKVATINCALIELIELVDKYEVALRRIVKWYKELPDNRDNTFVREIAEKALEHNP